jgi:acetyl esterase
MNDAVPPATLDPELAALGAHLKARGLAALSLTRAAVADCRAMNARIAAVLNENSKPLMRERDIAVPREDGSGGAVACRLYLPDGVANPPLMIYAHGGSFALGTLDAWNAMLRELVRASGVAVLSVDYRLSPEHRFPAAFDDMLAAVRHAAREGQSLGIDATRLAVGGDSAGGNLALAAALAMRDASRNSGAAGFSPLKFMLLIYGVYSTDNTTPAWATLGTGNYGLSAAQMDWIWAHYLQAPDQRGDWRVAPLTASMAGMPPAHLIIGNLDPLIDDSRALAQKLAAANVPHSLTVYDGLTHGFIRSSPHVGVVRRALADCAAALSRALAAPR